MMPRFSVSLAAEFRRGSGEYARGFAKFLVDDDDLAPEEREALEFVNPGRGYRLPAALDPTTSYLGVSLN